MRADYRSGQAEGASSLPEGAPLGGDSDSIAPAGGQSSILADPDFILKSRREANLRETGPSRYRVPCLSGCGLAAVPGGLFCVECLHLDDPRPVSRSGD